MFRNNPKYRKTSNGYMKRDVQMFPGGFEEEFTRKGKIIPPNKTGGLVRRTTDQMDIINNSINNIVKKSKPKPRLI